MIRFFLSVLKLSQPGFNLFASLLLGLEPLLFSTSTGEREVVMNKIALGLAILAGVATGGPAIAADLPLKAPPAPPAVVSDWSGFYIGAQFGGKWNNDGWTTTKHDLGNEARGIWSCGHLRHR